MLDMPPSAKRIEAESILDPADKAYETLTNRLCQAP